MSQPQPAPYPYSPPQSHPHSHDAYIAAIIIAVVVTAVVAGGIGYGLGSVPRILGTSPQPQQTFTFTHGTVDIGRSGTPFTIYFDNQATGTLSSTVGGTEHKYQLYLPTGRSYQVTIYWYGTSGFSTTLQSCTARPGIFTPSDSDYSQDFLC